MPKNFFNMRSSPGTGSIGEEFVPNRQLCQLCHNPLSGTTHSIEPCDSITVIPNLDRAFNLDTDVICVFPGKDGDQGLRRVQ